MSRLTTRGMASMTVIMTLAILSAAPVRAQDGPKPTRIAVKGAQGIVVHEKAQTVTTVGADRVAHTFRLLDGAETSAVALPGDWIAHAIVADGRGIVGARADGGLEYLALRDGAKPEEFVPKSDGISGHAVTLVADSRGDYVVALYRSRHHADGRELPEPVDRNRLIRISAAGKVKILRSLPDSMLVAGFGFGAGAAPTLQHASFGGRLISEDLEGHELGRSGDGLVSLSPGASSPTASHDGRWLAIHDSRADHALVMDTATGALVAVLDTNFGLPPVADDAVTAAASGDAFTPWGHVTFIPRRAVAVTAIRTRSIVRIWDVARGRSILDLESAGGGITGIAVSPEAKFLVASDSGGLTAWKLDALKLPRMPRKAANSGLPSGASARLGGTAWRTRDAARALAVAPDGATIVHAGPSTGRLVSRGADDGEVRWAVEIPGGSITQIFHSADGSTLICARARDRVVLVNAADGSVMGAIPRGDELGGADAEQSARRIAISADRRLLAMAGVKGTVIWDLVKDEGKAFMPSPYFDVGLIDKLQLPPIGLCFTGPDKSVVQAVWHDGSSRVLRLSNGTFSDAGGALEDDQVVLFAASSDGGRFVELHTGGDLFAGQTSGGKPWLVSATAGIGYSPNVVLLPGAVGPPAAARPGSTDVWFVDQGGILKRRRGSDAKSDAKEEELARVHGARLTAITFSRDGTMAYTASTDSTLCRWDAETGKPGPRPEGQVGTVFAMQYAPDGNTLAVGTAGQGVVLWSPETRRPVQTIETGGEMVVALGHSPDSSKLAAVTVSKEAIRTGAGAPRLTVWDVRTGKRQWRVALESRAQPRGISVSNDGRVVAVAAGADLLLVRTSGVTRSDHGLEGQFLSFRDVEFSSDNRHILANTRTTALRIDAKSARVVNTYVPDAQWTGSYGGKLSFEMTAFSPDGGKVRAVMEDGSVATWTVASGEPVARGNPVGRNVNGAYLAANGTVAVSSIRPGVLIARTVDGDRHVRSVVTAAGRRALVAVRPDGKEVAVAGMDGTILLWDLGE